MNEEELQRFVVQKLKEPDPVPVIDERIQELVKDGWTPEMLLRALQAARDHVDDEWKDDTIMEIMDCVVGYTNPSNRYFPDGTD